MTLFAGEHARIVIIGGGAIGASLAYHLTRAGERDVLLLEKAQLTHGCTWHAAGLVGQLRTKANLTRLMQNSVAVFDRLEAETGQAIDWKRVGSLRLASSTERWAEIRRTMTIARSFGFECHALSAREAAEAFPYIAEDGIVGAAFIPSDGYVDPYSLTMAYAKGARAGGARLRERVLVTDIVVENGRVTGVVTDHGVVGCDILVNCAGLWARRVGELAGVSLAAGVVEHQYFVTEQTLDPPPGLPTLRDPDRLFYLKPDVRSFAVGGWEEGTPERWTSRPPFSFGRELFPPDLDRLALFAEPAAERIPVLNETGIRTIVNGPIPVSADGEPIMGPVPGVDNLFVACGFTAGIAASGGAGEAMAAWILGGDPGMDLWPFDVRRFGPHHGASRHLGERAQFAYAGYYKLHYPGEEATVGRGLRRSPVHGHLAAAGAVFGSRFGWERANLFRCAGDDPADAPTFEGRPAGFACVAREVSAIRTGVALIDQTSFAKFEVTGPGAFAALQGLVANDLSGGPGKVTYTQILNRRGGIEADVTVVHPEPDRFFVITGSGFGVRDGGTLAAGLPVDGSVRHSEVTGAYGVLNLCGPRSREVLAAVSPDDVSNAAFPFLACRRIEIGDARVVASRIGYVGELGFEILVPAEYTAHAYETLKAAGAAHGLLDAGYKAIDSCRLEKGYLYWSADIGPDDDPYEAGLGFCVKPDKGPFVGREAVLARKGARRRKLASFAVDRFAPLMGGEAILADGQVIGSTTSGGHGHHLGKSIAFGYVPPGGLDGARIELEAFGVRHLATMGPRCLYDPRGERLKA
ncbi:MAG TPA: FAD-dependent oxidoreductase [Methylomirabilota bacterium]|nr:FAD-dependent oxidoreductase [Methylomirabilota bacterium]